MQKQKHMQESVSIFYSYAQEDEKLRKQLETHLSLLRQQGLTTEWHHRKIEAGKDWKQVIDTHLMNASVILLLISPDFLASDYCYGIEMQQALERHQKNEVWVIPILLRPTDWEDATFAHLQYLPHNRKPVTQWRNRDEAFVEIAKSLRAIVTGDHSPLDTSPDLSAPIRSTASSLSQQENRLNKTIADNAQKKPATVIHQSIHPLRRRSLNILAWLINLLATAILSTSLKLTPPLAFVPFIDYIQQHQLTFLILACGAILLTLIGSLIVLQVTSRGHRLLSHRCLHPWSLVTGTSTISFVLCFSLLMIVLFQPSWCLSTLCHSPIIVSGVTTNPQGVHDANLEIFFLTFESNAFVIPGDPAHAVPIDISNETNSHTISAVPLGNSSSTPVYRVVLVARDLHQGKYSVLIDQIALIVLDRPVTPQPLNIWANNSLVHYSAARYGVVYGREEPGTILSAEYLESPNGYTQLLHNEADQLDIQIASQTPVDLKFKMQVTYHIATETKISVLRLPEVFEVVFSNQSNWHPYQLQSGHFAKAE